MNPARPNSRRFERCVTSMRNARQRHKSSSDFSAWHFFTAIPSRRANAVAEITGTAASTSTAAGADEVLRFFPSARRASNQRRSSVSNSSKFCAASRSIAHKNAGSQLSALPIRARAAVRSGADWRRRQAQQAPGRVQNRTSATRIGARVSATGGLRSIPGSPALPPSQPPWPSPPSQGGRGGGERRGGGRFLLRAASTASARWISPSWSKSGSASHWCKARAARAASRIWPRSMKITQIRAVHLQAAVLRWWRRRGARGR